MFVLAKKTAVLACSQRAFDNPPSDNSGSDELNVKTTAQYMEDMEWGILTNNAQKNLLDHMNIILRR